MSEYIEHLNSDSALVSSTLASVLKQQTMLGNPGEEELSLKVKITGPDTKIITDDVQNISFSATEVGISFFTGYKATLTAQKLLNSMSCGIRCGSIEKDNIECIAWEATKVSQATFMVTLRFKCS